MKRWARLASFLLFLALCASAVAWAMQLFKPAARPLAAAAVPMAEAPIVELEAASVLFGARKATVTASNYVLQGVIVARNARDSVAILGADGKPPQAVAVGSEVLPGVTVKEVHPQFVLLSEGGRETRVQVPEPPSVLLSEGGSEEGVQAPEAPSVPRSQADRRTRVRPPKSPVALMRYWLMKSEPDEFSIDDLAKAPRKTTPWFGVRNYQARNFMRDQMSLADRAFFYHSSCPEPGIAGVCEIVSAAYPDATQFDRRSEYYDPRSTPDAPRWVNVDVRLVKKTRLVPLAELRAEPRLAHMRILQRGNRLSITPVDPVEWEVVLELAARKR